MLCVNMLSVGFPYYYSGYHYAECRYAECRYAECHVPLPVLTERQFPELARESMPLAPLG